MRNSEISSTFVSSRNYSHNFQRYHLDTLLLFAMQNPGTNF